MTLGGLPLGLGGCMLAWGAASWLGGLLDVGAHDISYIYANFAALAIGEDQWQSAPRAHVYLDDLHCEHDFAPCGSHVLVDLGSPIVATDGWTVVVP